jgi:Tfp pilus assembly protein PilF
VQGLACWTQALHVLGEFESAARVGRQWVAAAVAQDHASALEARSYLSIVLLDAGDVAESRALAAEVARERPADPGANVVLGLMAMESHDVQAAQTSFQAAAASARYVGRAWQGIALVHLHESRFEPACDALRHAIEADGRDVGSVVTLGWVHLLSGDIAAAREAFERAVQTDRNFAESHGGMASVMAVEGDLAGARQASRRARRLNRHGFGAEFADAVALDAAGARQDAMASVQRALHRTLPRAGEQPLIHHVRRYLESRRAHPDPQHRSET